MHLSKMSTLKSILCLKSANVVIAYFIVLLLIPVCSHSVLSNNCVYLSILPGTVSWLTLSHSYMLNSWSSVLSFLSYFLSQLVLFSRIPRSLNLHPDWNTSLSYTNPTSTSLEIVMSKKVVLQIISLGIPFLDKSYHVYIV